MAALLAGPVSAQKAETIAFDLSLLDDWITAAESFFVREHFPAPKVSQYGWKLRVGGAVAAPFEIGYDDLQKAAKRTLPVTLECAENPAGGGLVSHGEWSGADLVSLLDQARPSPDAKYVRLVGADGYSRSIPLAKARHDDTLVAYGMNGARLPDTHGFPARAVIPGWYGMDSVKWLERIEVLVDEDGSRFMTGAYVRQVRSLLAGVRPAGTVSAMNVKSVFSRPVDGAILTGRRFVIRGAAWAGENRVRSVEVSTDAGKTWSAGHLSTEALRYAWVHWTHEWRIPGPGSYELLVRATDDGDRTQPARRPPERLDDYEHDTYDRTRVMVA
jgi:DMSO/TMAO reductase YedYZ molybdopterin-dependent catalytic subunit